MDVSLKVVTNFSETMPAVVKAKLDSVTVASSLFNILSLSSSVLEFCPAIDVKQYNVVSTGPKDVVAQSPGQQTLYFPETEKVV